MVDVSPVSKAEMSVEEMITLFRAVERSSRYPSVAKLHRKIKKILPLLGIREKRFGAETAEWLEARQGERVSLTLTDADIRAIRGYVRGLPRDFPEIPPPSPSVSGGFQAEESGSELAEAIGLE